jgi:hypothetical protein
VKLRLGPWAVVSASGGSVQDAVWTRQEAAQGSRREASARPAGIQCEHIFKIKHSMKIECGFPSCGKNFFGGSLPPSVGATVCS